MKKESNTSEYIEKEKSYKQLKILKEKFKHIMRKATQHSKLYDLSNKHLNGPSAKLSRILKAIISPTWLIAEAAKKGVSKSERTKGIIARNYGFLFISIATSFAFLFIEEFDTADLASPFNFLVYFLFYIIIWSRCNEILFAFISDALDKSSNEESLSSLTYRKRIELALLSYIELILNYAIIILILPKAWLNESLPSITDAIYYSGVTITTLGYGELHPEHWVTKLLSIHEVLAGFTLIVVSFAMYSGRSSEK